MITAVFLCSALVAVSLSERIYTAPDVSWNRSPSSASDSGSGVLGRDNSDSDSDSSRFPITGNLRPGSRGSVSSSGSQFGSSAGTGSRVSGGSGSVGDSTRNYYVRIVASLLHLTNDKSLTSKGSSCSMFGKCDPIVYADLDTDRPNANWPGARDVKTWPKVFVGKSQDSFDVGVDNITRDVCGQNYREANLRVRVEDKKTLGSNAVINEFDCPINRVPDASSVSSAKWSPVINCIARFPAGQQTLSFRYKVFYVSQSACGVTTAPVTTTSRSIFG